MWHRLLLLLGLLVCTPAIAAPQSLNGLTADYQVALGLILSYGPYSVSPNVDVCPVFTLDGATDYEASLRRFSEEVAASHVDPNRPRVNLLLAPLQLPEEPVNGLVPIAWVGPFGLWAPRSTAPAMVQALERSLVSLNGQTISDGTGGRIAISSGGSADLLAKARAARAARAPAAQSAAAPTPPAPPAPPNPNLTDPPVSLQPPPPKHFDFGTGPSPRTGIDSWTLPPPPPPPKVTETPAQRKSRLQMLKNAEKQKADLEKQKSTERALKERRDLDALNKQQEDRKAKVKKSWQDRADYVDAQVKRADAITAGSTWSESAEIDGPNRWVHITLTNHTDIVMSVDLRYFGGKEGNQGDQWQPLTAVYPGNTDVMLFATDGKSWVVRDVRLKWEANGFEYSVNVIPN